MDAASKTVESDENTPSEARPGAAASPPDPLAAPGKRSRKHRRYAALAALLAVAVAVPLGVRAGQDPDAGAPSDRPEAAKADPEQPVTADAAMRRARSTGKDVEVTAYRSAGSTTWAQPDGLLRTRIHSSSIRAEVDGEWKPVDTDLRRVDGGYAPKAVNDPLLFSAGSGRKDERAARSVPRTALVRGAADRAAGEDPGPWSDLVQLTTGPHRMVVKWPGKLPEPVVSGPRALYEDVRPGIDLLLTARDSGFSHVLVVKNREAAQDPLLDRLSYRLASPTLKFVMDPESKAVSARDGEGQEFAASPTPYMWDSSAPVRTTLGEPAPTPDPAAGGTSLALPGLAGPQPGTRDAVLDAALKANGELDLLGADRMLADPDTVYPVFIDPSFKGRKLNWTTLYAKYPSSSFWNGQNFNDGANEARVGYERTTGGLSRSVFTFEFGQALHGTKIQKAYFRARQVYSWGCSARQFNLHLTGSISSSSTWKNQPTWGEVLDSKNNGYGYSADCPDQWTALNITSAAQKGADRSWSTLTLGLRAANESDTYAWKKFTANGENAPYIEVTHNRPPNSPKASAMKTYPGGTCDYTAPYPGIGKSDITFTVTASDPDGNLKSIVLKVWPSGSDSTTSAVVHQTLTPNSSGTVTATYPWSKFTSGKAYSWEAMPVDTLGETARWGPAETGSACQFTVDHAAPNSPEVVSDTFPPSGDDGSVWSTVTFGGSGTFTFSPAGSTDVKEYQYGFTTAFASRTATTGGPVTVTLTPPHAGPTALYVRSVDGTGNISRATVYTFQVRPAPVSDTPMDVTGDQVPDLYTVDADGNLALHARARGSDRLHTSMPAAYTTDTADGSAQLVADGYWTGALITHNGDWLPGDGIQDLVARMPDGKLYVYPGDGYGGFDVTRRVDVLLPSGAPSPASLRQILAVGDVTGDGRSDLLALAGADLWAFTGYTGVSFAKATHLTGESWSERDLVQVADVTADGAPDLVYRNNPTGQLHLRYGKKAAGGGLDLASIGTKAASAGQLDTYGPSGWSRSALPIVTGTPDISGDGVPDVIALFAAGPARVYPGRAIGLTSTTAFYLIKESVGTSWAGYQAIG
ncbi:DNRLRE domain-containing protein [Streptomyces sp. CC210A]|uniref:DNRLRE domain-containing protein n=1 Tax=Streptomyces sp. CC210A TaxID=2898184 RepID=UPI001F40FB12|nr:DNRLRE domain-containing protein [Streptomyces sp. CC210A]